MPGTFLISLAISVASLVAYIYCSWFWLTLWRSEKSGSAHAFFLMCASMTAMVVFELAIIATDMLSGRIRYDSSHNMYVWIFIGLNAAIHFLYARGYFMNV